MDPISVVASAGSVVGAIDAAGRTRALRTSSRESHESQHIPPDTVFKSPKTEGNPTTHPGIDNLFSKTVTPGADSLPPAYDHRKPWTKYPAGYPRFSAFIANDEDKSTTIFRRFQRLSARNLLYLESELADLEKEQDRLDDESLDDDDLRLSMKSWDLLCLQATPPREGEKLASQEEEERTFFLQQAAQRRLHLAWRIREVLKTYHESLKREHDILGFNSPERRPLKGTRRIFLPTYNEREGTGSGAGMIHGTMKAHLDRSNEHDLCVLAPPAERDRLTRLLEGRLSYFFRTRTDDGLSDFISHRKVSVWVSIISGILATIFLIGAVLGLYWVNNPNAKLGMLSGLTAGFAASLALFTNARRQDVFASTAAYAAVLVVFVSGNLGSTSGTTSNLSPAATVTNSVVNTVTSVLRQTSTAAITATHTTILSVTSGAASAEPTTSGSTGLSSGAKIGIGLGVSFGFLLLLVPIITWFLMRRKAKHRAQQAPTISVHMAVDERGSEHLPMATAFSPPFSYTPSPSLTLYSPGNENLKTKSFAVPENPAEAT